MKTDEPHTYTRSPVHERVRNVNNLDTTTNVSVAGGRSVSQENILKGAGLAKKTKEAELLQQQVQNFKANQNNDSDKVSKEVKKKELNMDPNYWRQNCLYPFALKDDSDDEEAVEPNLDEYETFVDNPVFKFPLHKLHKGTDGVLVELQTPLQITTEEIIVDLHKFASNSFPIESIPHTEGGSIIDNIHPHQHLPQTKLPFPAHHHPPPSCVMHLPTPKPLITRDDIQAALYEIDSMNFARFVGLIAHLTYWSVFGEINQTENIYKKDMFIEVMKIKTDFESRYSGKKKFVTLVMPLMILAIRLEMEVIFKNSYPLLFAEPTNEKIGMKLINRVITKALDPNLFCSRLSFFESDKEAISLKYVQSKKGIGLPSLKAKYNGRSSLLQTLIPVPSEGKIRKMFNEYKQSPLKQSHLPQLRQMSKSKTTSNLAKTVSTTSNRKGSFSSSSASSYLNFDCDDKKREMKQKIEEMNKKAKLFKIAAEKVNKNMKIRKVKPVFNLK